jgi:phosphoglucosamine mutase
VGSARFGTDGVRGVANEELTAELALALGRASARTLPAPTFVVGRDTRRSGPLLQAAFSAGLAAEGADVVDLGVLPTPGVAAVAESRGVPGAMISASHNPFGDNGIKLFSFLGTKLPVDVEAEVERELELLLVDPERAPVRPTGLGVGRMSREPNPLALYSEHLVATIEDRRLDGLRVVLDCANGAASEVAPWVFAELGARVTALHDVPDGSNINDGCGSTDPAQLALAVVEHQADLGLAFDGDADRVIAVDHTGTIVDGDVLLALFALDLAERGRLSANTVVVTVMTNLGFRLAMEARGIEVRETDVGDRHVLAALDAGGLSLGGEQSGHIIFRALSTTGDGVLTGIALADLLLRSGRALADLSAGLVERVPQRLVNVRIPQPERLSGAAEVWEAVVRAEAALGHEGRVLLRPSGTEPIVRVMVEARQEAQADAIAAQLAEVVETTLGQVDPPGTPEAPR